MRMQSSRIPGLAAVALLSSLVGLAAPSPATAGCGCAKPPPLAPPEAPTVTVRNPQLRSYAPTKEFNGRLVTKDPVKVVPQVSGMLLRRTFTEGQLVEKDKTLFPPGCKFT